MIRNGRHNAFISHPKAASMAVNAVLLKNDWRKTSGHHEIDFPLPKNVITIIREPRDWYVSWYFFRHVRVEKPWTPFAEWLETNMHEDPFIANGFFALKHTTHLVFFDRLQVGFDAVFGDLGLPRLEIPVHHATPDRDGATADEIFDEKAENLLDKGMISCYDSLVQRVGDQPYLRIK